MIYSCILTPLLDAKFLSEPEKKKAYTVVGQRRVCLNEAEWIQRRWVFNYLPYLLVTEHQSLAVHSI